MSPHGTISRYNNDRCRCDRCRAAASEYSRRRYVEDRAGVQRRSYVRNVPVHGTTARYGIGCRCTKCKAAKNAEFRAWKANRYQGQRQQLPYAPLAEILTVLTGRAEHELTQLEIAALCGVAPLTVASWRRRGWVGYTADRRTDEIACRLGYHPISIWGPDWAGDIVDDEAA